VHQFGGVVASKETEQQTCFLGLLRGVVFATKFP
jgi:hypothetical protein